MKECTLESSRRGAGCFLQFLAIGRIVALLALAVWLWCIPAFAAGPNVLIVVAHPDDESCFSGTTYRIAKELGGNVDQVVLTNGEGGFHYSALGGVYYGENLTDETVGRVRLPEIRKQELLNAGRILGIRHFSFLDQPDPGYTQSMSQALASWDQALIRPRLNQILTLIHYDYVLTLFPAEDTHGHHKAAAMLALQSVATLQEPKPVVLGCQPASAQTAARLRWVPATDLPDAAVETSTPLIFDRTRRFGFRAALDYQIIANWEIAEHKSQGLLQTDVNRYDQEEFAVFAISGRDGLDRARQLFEQQLAPMAATATRAAAPGGSKTQSPQ